MNILLIACDTTRADHLGCYGYFRDTSPNIDEVARKGVLFEDFHCTGSPTGPSFTSLYTGLFTINHKHYRFLTPNIRQVDDTIFTLPEILRALGYTTTAVDNLINFPPHSKHWTRGYSFYINPSHNAFIGPYELIAKNANKRLIPWIKNHSDEQFFLFVHYWDPHVPYNQPSKYRNIFHHKKGNLSDLPIEEAAADYKYVPGWGKVDQYVEGEITDFKGRRVSIDLYDGEIAYMDNAIGQVKNTLENEGILDDTVIIITSDHGEQLGQHYGNWQHEGLHESVTHVPLVIRYPKKLPQGLCVKGFCQHIDILPSILQIIGSQTDTLEIDGKSVMPLLEGKVIRDRLFMESASGLRGARIGPWKYLADIWVPGPHRELELYNVEEDPMEILNLAKTNKEKIKELKAILQEWVKGHLTEGELDPIEPESLRTQAKIQYQHKITRILEALKKGT